MKTTSALELKNNRDLYVEAFNKHEFSRSELGQALWSDLCEYLQVLEDRVKDLERELEVVKNEQEKD